MDGSRSSEDPVHLRCSGLVQDSILVSLSNEVHSLHAGTSGIRPFQDPSVKVAAAKERVAKLEIAMAAMEGIEGPDGAGCPPASVGSNPGVPINVQVKECESFLVRARPHLAELDSKRAAVLENMDASEKRLSELRAQLQTPLPSEESEVNPLRGLVSQLQAQVASLRGPSLDTQSPKPKRPRHREDFIPHCDEEMQEWMECRHQDLHAAVAAGQTPEVVRISQILTQAAQEWQHMIQGQSTSALPSAVANMVPNPLR